MARMSIELPNDIVKMVAQTAAREFVPKTEVIHRMFTILRITQEQKRSSPVLEFIQKDKLDKILII